MVDCARRVGFVDLQGSRAEAGTLAFWRTGTITERTVGGHAIATDSRGETKVVLLDSNLSREATIGTSVRYPLFNMDEMPMDPHNSNWRRDALGRTKGNVETTRCYGLEKEYRDGSEGVGIALLDMGTQDLILAAKTHDLSALAKPLQKQIRDKEKLGWFMTSPDDVVTFTYLLVRNANSLILDAAAAAGFYISTNYYADKNPSGEVLDPYVSFLSSARFKTTYNWFGDLPKSESELYKRFRGALHNYMVLAKKSEGRVASLLTRK